MRLIIEADEGEIESKRESLLKAMVGQFRSLDVTIADALEKALPAKKPTLKFQVLRDLHVKTATAYKEHVDKMLVAIGEVIDRSVVQKSLDLENIGVSVVNNPEHPFHTLVVESALSKKMGGYEPCVRVVGYEPGTKRAVVEDPDLAKSGPFFGPRGGKWQDAKHTTPWAEPNERKPKAQTVSINVHAAISGRGEDESKHQYHVKDLGGGKVSLSRHEPGGYGPTMPKESLKHFINDLAGKVVGPPSDNPKIQKVLDGEAKFLGKGDDGLAFKVGDSVVKVSTTVPFQPENPGHRTPDEAKAMLKNQVEIGNLLANKIPGIQRSKFVAHGDKGYQIKDYVEIPEKLTRAQLDEAQSIVIAMHKQGYSLNDQVQVGTLDGKVVMYDVGKADEIPEGQNPDGIYSNVTADFDNLKFLYSEHGEDFVRLDLPAGKKQLATVLAAFDRRFKKNPGFAHKLLSEAMDQRAKELRATLKGDELEAGLHDLDLEVFGESTDLEHAGFILPAYSVAEKKFREEHPVKKSLEKADEDDDPDYSEDGEPIFDPKTGMTPSETAAEPPDDADGDEGEELEASMSKRRGGPTKGEFGRGLVATCKLAKSMGGLLYDHPSDSNQVILRLPVAQLSNIRQVKQDQQVTAPIEFNGDFALLPIKLKTV